MVLVDFFNYLMVWLSLQIIALSLAGFLVFLFAPKKHRETLLSAISFAFILYNAGALFAVAFALFALVFIFLIQKRSFRAAKIALLLFPLAVFSTHFLLFAFNLFALVAAVFSFFRFSYLSRETRRRHHTHVFWHSLCYLFFFPSFYAGPVMRASEFRLLDAGFSRKDAVRIVRGIAKLSIAMIILTPLVAWLAGFWELFIVAMVLSGVKIFLLFAGFFDIAIASSRLLGVNLKENFPSNPFKQKNLTLFWRNWNATVTEWLREFVYLPLGGNNNLHLNVFAVFLLVGLAHFDPFLVQKEGLFVSMLGYIGFGLFSSIGLLASKRLEKLQLQPSRLLDTGKLVATVLYGSIALMLLFGV